MTNTREEILERMLAGYAHSYDVTRFPAEKAPLAATAFFHVHSAQYVMFKENEIWSANSNEYVYIYSMPALTEEGFAACMAAACADGFPRVEPDKNHMSSYINAVFVCESCTPGAKKALKQYRNRKSFHFSLHGWQEVDTAAVVLEEDGVIANYPSSDTAKFLKNVLHGRRRNPFQMILKVLRG